MPRFGDAQPARSAKDIEMIAQQWAMQHNANIRKQRRRKAGRKLKDAVPEP